MDSIYETLKKQGRFITFLTFIDTAGLAEILNGKENITVFAPTDEAYSKRDDIVALASNEIQKLTEILQRHIIKGIVVSTTLDVMSPLQTLAQTEISITLPELRVNGHANIIQADIECSNGIIHILDEVL